MDHVIWADVFLTMPPTGILIYTVGRGGGCTTTPLAGSARRMR